MVATANAKPNNSIIHGLLNTWTHFGAGNEGYDA